MGELELKLQRIRDLLDQHSLDGLLLRQAASFSWATCGASSSVNVADSYGVASLLITSQARYLITDNIEAGRLQAEQHLQEQGWEARVAGWYEHKSVIEELTQGLRLGADCAYPGATDLESDVRWMRAALLPEERDRFRQVSHAAAEAMDAAIMSLRPRLTEHQIAGILAREALNRGVEPIVHLVGTDERVLQYRHPVPTDKRLDKYAMLVLCGRKWGLVANITRLIHFGRIPDELHNKARAVALVDAHYITATRPGKTVSEVFREAAECYRLYGFEDEWHSHHQGGLAGYVPREVLTTPETQDEICVGQAYAWNPSIAGVKSEDTMLVGEEHNEILTAIPRWPVTKVNLRGQTIERPAILEVT
ncbi:MAG TPA: M24 family metallopeptidase [Anaerolineales bacterium]